MKSADRDREFELLTSAFRLSIKYRRQFARDAKDLEYIDISDRSYEQAIERRRLAALRATYGDLKGRVEDARWGPDFAKEFEALHGISFFDLRGKKGPDARLARILERGKIETPADLRCVQERLDAIFIENARKP